MNHSKTRKIPKCLLNRVDDKTAYEQYYNDGSTKAILKLLTEELRARIEVDVIKSEGKDKFEYGNWEHYQASSIGYRKALRELIRLLDQ